MLIQQVYRSYRFVEENLVAHIGNLQKTVSDISARNFESYLLRLLSELASIASDSDVIRLNERGKSKLSAFQKVKKVFVKSLWMLDGKFNLIFFFPISAESERLFIEYKKEQAPKPILSPVISEPLADVKGEKSIPITFPVMEDGKFKGSIVVILREESLSNSFLTPLLNYSTQGFTGLADKDGKILWSISAINYQKVQEGYWSEQERENLRLQIASTNGNKAIYYSGSLPEATGKWIIGIAPINLGTDKTWYLISAVPSTTLESSLATYRIISLGMATVVALIFVSLLWALLRAQKESYIIKERAKLADEFELTLKERTAELASAKESLSIYAKNLEAQIEERTKKLKQSEEMYRQLVENVGTAIFILRGSKIAYVNPAFLASWKEKTQPSHWVGEELIYFVSKSRRPNILNALSRLNEGEEFITIGELEIEENESNKRIWEGTLKRVQLLERCLIIGFFNDITQRKTLERQVLQAQKLESMGRLAGGIAHDFNNILAAIFGHLTLLREEAQDKLTSEALNLISTVENAAKRAADLTKKLLVFTRRSEEVHHPVDINKSLNDVSELVRTSLTRGITFTVKKTEEKLVALADPIEVQQVLMNLCINAIEAMPDGGRLSITAGLVSREEDPSLPQDGDSVSKFVRIRVIDTGHGIDPSILPHIFEPFFTTKEVGKGSGLGLSIAYHIARKHNGYLCVDSDWGRGSVFTLYLPAALKGEELAGKREEYRFPNFSGSPPVLMADDEEMITAAAQKFFSNYGLTILTARDGVEAIDLFKKHQFEVPLVILDMRMPRMSGPEVFRLIHKINPNVTGILITGFSEEVDSGFLDNLGFKEIIRKPYTFEELSKTLAKYLLPLRKNAPEAASSLG